MSDKERHYQPLYSKIENTLPILYAALMPNGFKEKWVWPKRDPKTGLFRDRYCKGNGGLLGSQEKEEGVCDWWPCWGGRCRTRCSAKHIRVIFSHLNNNYWLWAKRANIDAIPHPQSQTRLAAKSVAIRMTVIASPPTADLVQTEGASLLLSSASTDSIPHPRTTR